MEEINFKNKQILVIGGAGFTGSHLIESLLAHTKNIVSLDNYSSGKKKMKYLMQIIFLGML